MDSLLNKAVVQHAIKARDILDHLRKPRPLTRKFTRWRRGGVGAKSIVSLQYRIPVSNGNRELLYLPSIYYIRSISHHIFLDVDVAQ